MDDLVERDGIKYKKFSDVPFTGEIEHYRLLKMQGAYKNGKKEGPWVVYHANGQLMEKGAYKNGKTEGPWVVYYYNGQLGWKGTYKNGKQEGRWVWYRENGNLKKEYSGVFKDGVKISD